jgi:hypothetical protein
MELINAPPSIKNIFIKTGWKRPDKNLYYIYKNPGVSEKTLNWFLSFLSKNTPVPYEKLIASAPNRQGGEGVLTNFGFNLNFRDSKKNVTVDIPPYAKQILEFTQKKESPSSSLEEELRKTREELRKCREEEGRRRKETSPVDDTPPPGPQRDDSDLEKEEVPTPPSAPVKETKKVNLNEEKNDLTSQLQKAKLKKTDVPEKKKVEEEENFLVNRAREMQATLDARRKAIAPEEEDDNDWDTSNNCIICDKISFMKCECCFNVYCSSNCQRINH